MCKRICLALVVSLTLAGSAHAQLFRGRTAAGAGGMNSAPPPQRYFAGADGTIYVVPANYPGTIIQGNIISSADPCCPCPPGSSGCKDDCINPPRIIHKPYNCPPSEVCKPIPVVITPGPGPDCVEIPFYGKPVAFKHKAKVPVVLIECEEVIRFMDYTIDLKCCEIKLCVPCERCIVKREKCVEQEKEVSIEAFRRRDGTIDVYALNVPGLPTKFVLRLKMSESDFKAAYPGHPVPTYP